MALVQSGLVKMEDRDSTQPASLFAFTDSRVSWTNADISRDLLEHKQSTHPV